MSSWCHLIAGCHVGSPVMTYLVLIFKWKFNVTWQIANLHQRTKSVHQSQRSICGFIGHLLVR